MKLTASKKGTSRYFFAKLGWKEQFDPREIDILTAGALPMLIPPSAIQGHNNRVIQYEISSYSTLEFYLSCILSREQFAKLLLQCIDLFRQMQKAYLNYKNLVLELDQIYVLLSDRTLHFIYLPVANSSREASIPEFFRHLVQKASRSTYEQVSFLDSCLAWLDRPVPFVMDAFEDFVLQGGCVRESAEVCAAAAVSTPSPASVPTPDELRFYHPLAEKMPEASPVPYPHQGSGTTQLNIPDAGGTVVLADGPAVSNPRFYLVRKATDERVEISRSPFLVGSERGSTDYCVTGNATISRKHALFLFQDGQCSVIDQKSTNRTYVNDCALEPNVAQPLHDGDLLRLANEDFTFVQEG